MTFEIVLRYISVHCDMQLTFFDLRMDGKKGQRRCSEKIKWKSLWFTRQNFQRIECSSVKYKRGRLQFCNERSYRDLKRLEKILEDAKSLQQESSNNRTTNNRTKRCVPSDSRISPIVSASSKSLRHDGSKRNFLFSCDNFCDNRAIYTRKNKTRTFRINGTFRLK